MKIDIFNKSYTKKEIVIGALKGLIIGALTIAFLFYWTIEISNININ